MLCRDIMDAIEASYPRECALSWDNVGLLVGDEKQEVRKVYVALDATDEVVDEALKSGADMLVTHHPMIFSGMKRINESDFIGRRIIKLIKGNVAYYAMHTNYDVMGMGQLAYEKLGMQSGDVLEITCSQDPINGRPEGIGRVGELEKHISLGKYIQKIKDCFELPHVKVFGELDFQIKKIAISPGSGKSMIGAALDAGADLLITGDIDHHTGIDAVAQGLAVVDAGHYGIEYIFIRDIAEYLRKKLPGIQVIETPVKHPFLIL